MSPPQMQKTSPKYFLDDLQSFIFLAHEYPCPSKKKLLSNGRMRLDTPPPVAQYSLSFQSFYSDIIIKFPLVFQTAWCHFVYPGRYRAWVEKNPFKDREEFKRHVNEVVYEPDTLSSGRRIVAVAEADYTHVCRGV